MIGKSTVKIILLTIYLSARALGQTVSTDLETKFLLLRDTTSWKLIDSVSLTFPAHHPQGMVKIGSYFYMSSVEVRDRAAGKGVGHLFKFDSTGNLLADIRIGEEPMYHPGGIDFDGKHIWIPLAEYRASSGSIVYKIDPTKPEIAEVLRFDDHLGGIVHDTDSHKLHGINWGSRGYYRWEFDSDERIINNLSPEILQITNSSYYIDYQDCHYVGNHRMLCGGVKNYRNGNSIFRFGGLELVDLATHRAVHQVPVQLWSPFGRPMTQNPFWLESTESGIRAYFIPDDDKATMYVYDVVLPR